jgi:hypothetical protein
MVNAQRAQYAQEQALYNQRYRAGPSCQRYGPPPGDPYMYGPGYGSGYGYGYDDYGDRGFGRRRRNNGGGALPLLGALAGGLLLGDILF